MLFQLKRLLVVATACAFQFVGLQASIAKDKNLSDQFQGLWVGTAEHDACSAVKRPIDTMSAGEGAIFLDGTRYYSQETRCEAILAQKSCCDSDGEDTRGGTLTCGKEKSTIILQIRPLDKIKELTVATHAANVSEPTIKRYIRCK